MKLGDVLKKERERRGLDAKEVAARLGVSPQEYAEIEAGESPLEKYGRFLLGFAEVVEQPVFDLFYPAGLSFQELDDYP